MSQLLTCAQGHRWDPRLRKQSSADVCPTCGDLPLVQPADDAFPAWPSLGAAPAWETVRLGPDLPLPVFTSSEVWNPQRIGALALYCSDGRWGEAFDEFCHRSLHIPRYDRWVVPGGPVWLLPRESAREFYQTEREQLDFLVRVHELERVVLITHFGCAFYGELLKQDADRCLPRQMEDLRAAAEVLREWFPSVAVEGYLAMRQERCLTFHEIQV